jgi:ABC-type glutathione transport system ATPase component
MSAAPVHASNALLHVSGLTKRYPKSRSLLSRASGRGGTVCTVHDVSFVVARGDVLGIVGESGSGKTTVARMLLRLVEPSDGRIELDGRDILALDDDEVRSFLRPRARMVFQDPDAALNPAYPVGEGLARAIRLHDAAATDVDRRVLALISAVGLDPSYALKYPDQLSGGEKRRLGISRALSTNPSLIVADEPLSGLDVVLQEHVLSLLLAEQLTRKFGLVLVSHDLDRVQQVCDRVLVMFGGRIVELAPIERGASEATETYRHPYSLALQAARERVGGGKASMALPVVELDRESARQTMVTPGADGVGCVWAGRCERQMSLNAPRACREETPVLSAVADGHFVACHFRDTVSS